MPINQFVWDIYKNSERGKRVVEIFTDGDISAIINEFLGEFYLSEEDTIAMITELCDCTIKPIFPDSINFEQAQKFFNQVIEQGLTLKFEDEIEEIAPNIDGSLEMIPVDSVWLFTKCPEFFKPYFFKHRFRLLTQIADAFGIDLPEVPLKRYKEERVKYYWSLCASFYKFQTENQLSAFEFCAFLYDFAPKYIQQNNIQSFELPRPTQVWLVGGDKSGIDFEFLDNYQKGETSFWQCNLDTKRGDIVIMYCLAPRSCIHSIWRATADGIADPFFHYYSSIYIGDGQKIVPISLKQLKTDEYFKHHPLVRKNLQGVNGYSFNSDDYNRILTLIEQNGGDTKDLPRLYSPSFEQNRNLNIERDVEEVLIEPFLKELGYKPTDWVRQLSVRMGRGERNFPDYAFLTKAEKGYEQASILIEAKFWIKSNKELEETFKQVWSYGLRLSAKVLIIADKEAIWIYEKSNDTFDRTKYTKKFWKELENADNFRLVKSILGE